MASCRVTNGHSSSASWSRWRGGVAGRPSG
jgi:hypothetical protein